jgi:hypothetical protein
MLSLRLIIVPLLSLGCLGIQGQRKQFTEQDGEIARFRRSRKSYRLYDLRAVGENPRPGFRFVRGTPFASLERASQFLLSSGQTLQDF